MTYPKSHTRRWTPLHPKLRTSKLYMPWALCQPFSVLLAAASPGG